jgi:hypothetical protein
MLYASFCGRASGAKHFGKWVTSEVLPSILRTGKYGGGTVAFIRRWHRVDGREADYRAEGAVVECFPIPCERVRIDRPRTTRGRHLRL